MNQVVQRSHQRRRITARPGPGGLLCVSNFPANTGYAWDFIEDLFAGLANRLAARGVKTYVAYPALESEPKTLAGSEARAVHMDGRLSSITSLSATLRFIREQEISVLYFCDRPVWDPRYALLRRAGVKSIIVHDHTSGERTTPRVWKRLLKRARKAIPGSLADHVLAVSDFVADRQKQVEFLADDQITRVWNSLPVRDRLPDAARRLRRTFDLNADRLVVGCACRATPEKGIATLFHAFEQMVAQWPADLVRPALVYLGDGPALEALRDLREKLGSKNDVTLGGYRADAAELMSGADVCVVPSVWEEAFGLAALEPMAYGVPVIASRIGGLPEVVAHGETGLLVTPGSVGELAAALSELLRNETERVKMGASGQNRARRFFSREGQLAKLESIFERAFQ